MAIEEGRGGWCDDCTCNLTYHVSIPETGECELCTCISIYKKIEPPIVMALSSAHIPIRRATQHEPGIRLRKDEYDRNKEARLVLAELTE
jgi:hypothetical protein